MRTIALLPGTVTIVIPALILWSGGSEIEPLTAALGAAVALPGVALVAWTVMLFVTVGRGTLARRARSPLAAPPAGMARARRNVRTACMRRAL